MAQNNDTELYQILNRVTTKETPNYVSLSPKMQSLVTIATLSTLGDEDLLSLNIAKALKDGVAPVEIRETIYQGMARAISESSQEQKKFLCRNAKKPALLYLCLLPLP